MDPALRLAELKVMKTPDGRKIKIIESIGTKWKDVGDLLDFDAAGTKLNQIEANKGGEGVESCCRAMFQYWLEGNGVQPVSLDTLIEILEDCNLKNLADQITDIINT